MVVTLRRIHHRAYEKLTVLARPKAVVYDSANAHQQNACSRGQSRRVFRIDLHLPLDGARVPGPATLFHVEKSGGENTLVTILTLKMLEAIVVGEHASQKSNFDTKSA